jgi:hypothetical protein
MLMQAPATKETAQPLNWRQKKKLNEPVARRKQLVAGYIQALGGRSRITAIMLEDIHRAADLVLLAREMRAAVRQGSAKVSDLTRLEGAADRAVRRLNLPPPNAAAPVMGIQDIVARHAADRAKPEAE